MRIDNPSISGSISFIAGTNFLSGSVVSLTGSFTGSFAGDGAQVLGVISSSYSLTSSYSHTSSYNQNPTISGSISGPDWIDFVTGSDQPIVEGRLGWDSGNGTLALGLKGGNVTLQIGQEQVARVFNADSIQLTDGMIVYISGSQGNRIAVKRANASNELGSANTIGMVTEPIDVGAEGFVTTFGVVNGLNTIGLTPGTPLWLNSGSGEYSQNKPNAPYHNVLVGYVQRVHASAGSIFVKVDNGYEIDELHNVEAVNAQEGDLLIYSASLWHSSKQLSGSYSLTGDLSVAGTITAQEFHTEFVSSSIIYQSGSTQFGNSADDTHLFTGSVRVNGGITGSVNSTGHFLPSQTNTYDLGSPNQQWRDLYLSSASLYVDGVKIISSDANVLTFTTDTGQSIKLLETGADDITFQTEAGNIELKGTVEILTGKKIIDSAGTIIQFGDSLGISGSVEVLGTVDGIDLQAMSSSLETRVSDLELFSSSISTDFADITNKPTLISSSAQFIDPTAPFTGSFSGSFYGDGSNLSGVTSYTDADTLAYINSINVVSGSFTPVSTVSDTFTSATSHTVAHNFDTKEVIVSVYENDTLIFPSSITTPTANTVTVTFPEPVTGRVVVVKAGHIVSGSIGFANIINKPTLISSSAQIASDISGSFTSISSSLASRLSSQEQYSSSYAPTLDNITDTGNSTTNSISVGAITASAANFQFSGYDALNIGSAGDITIGKAGQAIQPSFISYEDLSIKGLYVSASIAALESAPAATLDNITDAGNSTTNSITVGGIFVGDQNGDFFRTDNISGKTIFESSITVNGGITSTGTIVAQTLNVQQVTSSIVYSSGSNIFGNDVSDTQQFTGSLQVSGTGRFTGTIYGGNNIELVNAGGNYVLVGEGTGVNQYGAIDWDVTNNRLRIATQPYAFGASGGQITLTTDGYVGIGTISPTLAKLQVEGNASTNGLSIKSGGNGGTYPLMVTWSGGTAGDAFCVDDNLFVGIGTTSPATSLHVLGSGEGIYVGRIAGAVDYGGHVRIQKARGTVASPAIVANGDTLGSLTFEPHNGTGYTEQVGIRAIVNGAVSAGSIPTDLFFAAGSSGTTGANERMRIKSDGNVGIGTTSPGSKLDVAGRIRSYASTGEIYAYSTAPANWATIYAGWTGGTGMMMRYHPNTAEGYIENNYEATSGQVFGDINFRQNVAGTMTTRMIIKADGGNVGIGRTNPAYRLDIYRPGASGVRVNTIGSSFGSPSLVVGDASSGMEGIFTVASGGVEFGTYSNNDIIFKRHQSERARITVNGLTFNGDTAAANALDDYEEGTWTPTLPNGGTLVIQSARYVKIGQQVTVSLYVTSVNPTFNTSEFRIGGLPFANGSYNLYYGGSFGWVGGSNLNSWLPITGGTLNYIYFNDGNGNDPSQTKTNANYVTVQGDVSEIVLTMTYFAAT